MVVGTPSLPTQKYQGMDRERLIWAYRIMLLSRKIDEREMQFHRQGKAFFQVSASGHEALQVAAAVALRPAYDWFFPYYRDKTWALGLGVTPLDLLLESVG